MHAQKWMRSRAGLTGTVGLDDLHTHGALREAKADAPIAVPSPTDRLFVLADLFVGIGAIDRHIRPALRTHDEGGLNAAARGRQSVDVLARVRVLRHVLKILEVDHIAHHAVERRVLRAACGSTDDCWTNQRGDEARELTRLEVEAHVGSHDQRLAHRPILQLPIEPGDGRKRIEQLRQTFAGFPLSNGTGDVIRERHRAAGRDRGQPTRSQTETGESPGSRGLA